LDIENCEFVDEIEKKANEFVREDRVWKYHQDFNNAVNPSDNIDCYIGFEGISEINGLEYHCCKIWSDELGAERAVTIAYAREEDGKVYVLMDSNMLKVAELASEFNIGLSPISSPVAAAEIPWEQERLAYDFNLTKGDILKIIPEDIIENPTEVKTEYPILDDFDVAYDNESYHIQELVFNGSKFHVIGSIGATFGLLPIPGAEPMTYSNTPHKLVGIYDREGNLVLNISEITRNLSTVNEISDNDGVRDVEYYNMQGNRISCPEKGVIIKVERKYSGDTKVEKIIL